MTESLGTRDVLEQVDTRLGNLEQDLRQFRTEVARELGSLRAELRAEFQQGLAAVRAEVQQLGARLDTTTRWLVGLILLSWLSLMASIWLRP